MTTIGDLDAGQVLGIVDGRDSTGVGDWLKARPLPWRLGVQVVAIDPSAAFRKALRMWLPRTAVSVDAFHLVMLGNAKVTGVRQRLTQETKGRRGRAVDPVWANRRLRLKDAEKLSDRVRNRLEGCLPSMTRPAGLKPFGRFKEQLRVLLRTGSLQESAAAKAELQRLVILSDRPEARRLHRTVCLWWNEIEVLIVTGAGTAKVEANNTAIKRIGRGYRNARNYRTCLTSATRTAA